MNNSQELVVLLETEYPVLKNSSTQNLREALIMRLNWDTHYWVDKALIWLEQGFEAQPSELTGNQKKPNNMHYTFIVKLRSLMRIDHSFHA